MELKDAPKKKNTGLIAIIVILLLLLLGSLGYIYKLSNTHAEQTKVMLTEKEQLDLELKDAIAKYDEAISENTSLSTDLAAERDKLVQLQKDLEKSKGDAVAMKKYKDQYFKLKGDMDKLLAENNKLKKENQKLTVERDSTMTELSNSKISNDNLITQNDELAKKVEKASKLVITNVSSKAIKQGGFLSSKNKETDKASKADVLNVSFTIAANSIAPRVEKMYYIQVIDSENNVLGDKETKLFGEKYLTYSFTKELTYENKSIQITQDIPVKNLKTGLFFVHVFDGSEMVGSSSFTLK